MSAADRTERRREENLQLSSRSTPRERIFHRIFQTNPLNTPLPSVSNLLRPILIALLLRMASEKGKRTREMLEITGELGTIQKRVKARREWELDRTCRLDILMEAYELFKDRIESNEVKPLVILPYSVS